MISINVIQSNISSIFFFMEYKILNFEYILYWYFFVYKNIIPSLLQIINIFQVENHLNIRPYINNFSITKVLTLDAKSDWSGTSHTQIVTTLTRIPTRMATAYVSYDQSAGTQENDFDIRVDANATVVTAIL